MTGTATMKVGQFGRPTLSKDGRTITVHIPLTLRHQGGRKQVVTPAGHKRADIRSPRPRKQRREWRSPLRRVQGCSGCGYHTGPAPPA
jgi:hypothetical protein